MQEEWKTVSDNDNYEVSNLGKVRNRLNGKILFGSKNTDGYYIVKLYKNRNTKSFLVHRLVAIEFVENPGNLPLVDHIDRNPVNNVVDNLRWCTPAQNSINRSKPSVSRTSKFKGVYFCRSQERWRAEIVFNGKRKYLGEYTTEMAAAEAYNKAAPEIHGEFAVLNDLTPKPKPIVKVKVVVTKKQTT